MSVQFDFRRSRPFLAAVLAPLLFFAAACGSDEDPVEDFVFIDAWARPVDAGEDAIVNFVVRSPVGDQILGASVLDTVASGVELRDQEGAPIDSIDLPEDTTIVIGEDSFAVALVEVVDPLVVDDRFELTVDFREAGEQFIAVVVEDRSPDEVADESDG
jgi:copper(I)-binding protein